MKKQLEFPGQRPDEKLILLVRRHWTRIFFDITKAIFGLILPIAAWIIAYIFIEISITSDFVYMVIVMVVSLYYLFIMLLFLHNFVDYQLDLWVVSDQRIINIEQNGLFNRVTSSQSIERVQDVTSEVKGKIATFLDYGNVYIQTAAEQERFIFEEVPHPSKIAKIVQDVHDRIEEEEEKEDREELAKAINSGKKDLSSEPARENINKI